ncbi:hypothetical protein OG304_37635 [Streptomyces sp. NBC_00160]|uniref:hypothetical protein n=1 Tax=Streptomyces sp. NBC_00160 TaxID=2903628 RepID=UPI0022516F63|nr:hypothetical protein [Streptomyces sp. NBC_00160]MCX5309096.1 hypothetical protein [Streptomyces sp. NBC_00160]
MGLTLLLVMTGLGLLIVLRQVTGPLTALLLDATLALWCAGCWILPALVLRHPPAPTPHPEPSPRSRPTRGLSGGFTGIQRADWSGRN